MRFESAEDRLNPLPPEDADETTLGGYPRVHGRAAAFEGADGQPYTAAIETERTEGEERPWAAYLVFVRWAQSGSAIMGHVETGDLAYGETEEEVRREVERLPLRDAKAVLDETLARRARELEED